MSVGESLAVLSKQWNQGINSRSCNMYTPSLSFFPYFYYFSQPCTFFIIIVDCAHAPKTDYFLIYSFVEYHEVSGTKETDCSKKQSCVPGFKAFSRHQEDSPSSCCASKCIKVIITIYRAVFFTDCKFHNVDHQIKLH